VDMCKPCAARTLFVLTLALVLLVFGVVVARRVLRNGNEIPGRVRMSHRHVSQVASRHDAAKQGLFKEQRARKPHPPAARMQSAPKLWRPTLPEQTPQKATSAPKNLGGPSAIAAYASKAPQKSKSTSAKSNKQDPMQKHQSGRRCASTIPRAACLILRKHDSDMFANYSLATKRQRRDSYHFLHIPKSGGTTVESVMHIPFQGHNPLLQHRQYKQYRWITVVRDPLDRIASEYYFMLRGERQKDYRKRQAQLCQGGTGRAFKRPCIPKVSLTQYIFRFVQPFYPNYQWWLIAGDPTSGHKYLRGSKVAMWRHLTQYFWLMGTTKRLLEFLVLARDILGLSHGSVKSGFALNAGAHASPQKTLSKLAMAAFRRRNWYEHQLYEVASEFITQHVRDYGEERMKREIKKLE